MRHLSYNDPVKTCFVSISNLNSMIPASTEGEINIVTFSDVCVMCGQKNAFSCHM